MRLIVMSDSHGRDEMVEAVLKQEPEADYYLHCGDLCSDPRRFPQLILVQGNMDYFPEEIPLERVIHAGKTTILMVHGHRFPGYDRLNQLAREARKQGCDLVVWGHTHRPEITAVDGITLANPGSLYYNRDRSRPGYLVVTAGPDGFTVERKTVEEK
jgi:putative phosphoesterase